MSASFDFSANPILYLGSASRTAAVAIALSLAALPQAHAGTGVSMAPMPSDSEMLAMDAASIPVAGLDKDAIHARVSRVLKARLARQEARSAFAAAAEAQARKRGTGSCFAGFVNPADGSEQQSKSVVQIVAVDRDGMAMEVGSGFIVRDSDTPGNHLNKVVTARHVVNPDDLDRLPAVLNILSPLLSKAHSKAAVENAIKAVDPRFDVANHALLKRELANLGADGLPVEHDLVSTILHVPIYDHVNAYGSDGTFLGRMEVVSKGGAQSGKTLISYGRYKTDGSNLQTEDDDWATVQVDMRLTPKRSVEAFASLPGLRLAQIMSPLKTIGMSGDGIRPAIQDGNSGGPVFDEDGAVHAIVSGGMTWDSRIPVSGMISPVVLNRSLGEPDQARGTVEMSMRSVAIMTPLGNPRLLASLGRAGMGVRVSYKAPLYAGERSGKPIRFTSLGMPSGFCSATTVASGPIGKPLRDVHAVHPGSSAPFEIRKGKDGSVVEYDENGIIARSVSASGVMRMYENGIMTRQVEEDGSWTDYEGGVPVLSGDNDGNIHPVGPEGAPFKASHVVPLPGRR